MTLYTVYSGELTGPAARSTEDPALALQWGRTAGATAYVTAPTFGPTLRAQDVVWTPQMDRICVGALHNAIVDRAVASAGLR